MPTPHGSRGGMAFSADELRVLRCALDHVAEPKLVSERDVRACLRLARAVDLAAIEATRARAFLIADLGRYRAALPGAAVGFLATLAEALSGGYRPTDEDLSALRQLCAARTGPRISARRLLRLVREARGEAANPVSGYDTGVRRVRARSVRGSSAQQVGDDHLPRPATRPEGGPGRTPRGVPAPLSVARSTGDTAGDSAKREGEPFSPTAADDDKRTPRPVPARPRPERPSPASPHPARPVPTPGEVFPPRRRPKPQTEGRHLSTVQSA